MPIYVFKCDTCQREIDVMRKMEERNDPEPCAEYASPSPAPPVACPGALVRNEAAEVNAHMGHFWKP